MPYSPWIEQSQNNHPNPRYRAGGASFVNQTGVGSFALGVDALGDGRTWGQFSTTQTTAAAARLQPSTQRLACLPGDVIYASVTVRNNSSGPRSVTVQVRTASNPANSGTYTQLSTYSLASNQVMAAGEVRTFVGSITVNDATAQSAVLSVNRNAGTGAAVGDQFQITDVWFSKSPAPEVIYDGNTPNDPSLPSLFQYVWLGTANSSFSSYQTRTYTPPPAVIPVQDLDTGEVLYGDRITEYRWEVLQHGADGTDHLIGVLDGVTDEATLNWTLNVAVKGSGNLSVLDLETAAPGMLRVADLELESVRLRPVCVIAGLPENPLSTFLVSAAVERWESTGRTWAIELLDRNTVPAQDKVEESYAVAAGTLILQEVRDILATCGEYVAVDDSVTVAVSKGMVWEAGTAKLTIINDLLEVANYNSLWLDGQGNYQLTPRVLPADRPLQYEVLGLPRELRDGEQSIYRPDWSRDRDSFEVPNKVVAVEAGDGEYEALVGSWTNEDENSPFSYQKRGRWITHVLDSVEVPDGNTEQIVEFLRSRARVTLLQMSAVQAAVKVENLPIPVRVGDAIQFAHSVAGIDSRHIITRIKLDATPLGMMSTELQEVISL
jgi:hypothetical protein